MREGIAAAGNWIVDNVKIVDSFPEEGTLANILEEKHGTGGAAYNCLINLAKLNPKLTLEGIGVIGDDESGRRIISDLDKHGIKRNGIIQTSEAPTSYTDVITVTGTGYRTFFHNRGANALLDREAVNIDSIKARIIHVGYLLLLDKLDSPDPDYGTRAARLLHDLRAAGITVSVDVVSENSNRFNELVTPALPHIDYLILNEFEAGRITGHIIREDDGLIDTDNLVAAGRRLLEGGVNKLVCIHMPEGGFLIDKDGDYLFQPSLLLPEGFIKGTAGAGDAFCSGMLLGLYEECGYKECLKLAVCAAAACLEDSDCTSSMRTRKEVLKLSELNPFCKPIM